MLGLVDLGADALAAFKGKHQAVRRFRGERLPAKPRIALITSDALGNYVAVTPLIQLLRRNHPECVLHYYSGTRTAELWEAEPLIDLGIAALESPARHITATATCEPPYDLVINLEKADWARCLATRLCGCETLIVGPALDREGRSELPFEEGSRGELWEDPDWCADDLVGRYPFLGSGFISEIFCRLCYQQGPIPPYSVPVCEPGAAVPDVLISTAASLPEKLWPTDKWLSVARYIESKGLSMGIIGAAKPSQSKYWLGGETEDVLLSELGMADIRGKLSLPRVVGALAKCRKVVTIDNGILHLAAAAKVPTVGLFRPAIQRLWAPPVDTLEALSPQEGAPVSDLAPSQVIAQLGL
jgi:ADP-heptose:LPS heptosyltransferase